MKKTGTNTMLIGAAVSGAVQTTWGLSPVSAPEYPPVRNIVFILADDLGTCDLGCYGSEYYETPNLDRLAAEGMRFSDAYASSPVCSPTRASILTGRYPHRIHLTTFVPGERTPASKLRTPQDWIKYLRTNEFTYAEAFRSAGFTTFHTGKWHVDSEYNGTESPGHHGFETVHPGTNPWEINRDDPHHINEYTSAVESFISAHAHERFLAVLSLDQVHVPIYEQEEWIARFENKPAGRNGQNNPVMAAMIARMDRSVGRVLAKLDELGLSSNTAVVFFSDNGGLETLHDEGSGTDVLATSNLPYRGGKSKIYEGGIRVPCIIKWPGAVKPGSECRVPVISTDLYPTFLAMAGLPLVPEQHLDGMNLVPLLRGGLSLARNCLYWHYPHYQTLPPHSAVRCGDWKLLKHYETDAIELFNLADDKGEQTNLAAQFPEKAEMLRQYLEKHLEAIGAQIPDLNPKYDPIRNWKEELVREKFDPFEKDQPHDPRIYITDPARDYGAVRTGITTDRVK